MFGNYLLVLTNNAIIYSHHIIKKLIPMDTCSFYPPESKNNKFKHFIRDMNLCL